MCVSTGHPISFSPEKSKYFAEKCNGKIMHFEPAEMDWFYCAHTKEYINAFFNGIEPLASSCKFQWSKEFANSQYYKVGSLYAAIEHVLLTDCKYAVSPVSEFHHATPHSGKMFCALSGQVVASHKIYEQYGAVGAYIDLDSHYGNSINDSIKYNKSIDNFIKSNINPKGFGESYMKSLKISLGKLKRQISQGQIQYVVYCHGTDSLEGDPLGYGQCDIDQWFHCTELICDLIKETNTPLVLCLFGGYSKLQDVVDLHVQDATMISKLINHT